MKKITSTLLIAIIALACGQKAQNAFIVKGEILNASGKKISLIQAPFTNEQPIVLDSAIIAPNGSFVLKGKAGEETIYNLTIENGPNLIVVNDTKEVSVHMDINDYRHYATEGSPASANLHDLFEDYHAKDSTILANFQKINALQSTPGSDSTVEQMKLANDRNIEGLNALLNDFLKNNNSPAAVLYALGIASQTIKKEELKKMIDAAAGRFPTYGGLARVKAMMAMSKPAPEEKPVATYALLNKQAPNLTMPGLNGKNVSISNFKGKFLLVDFWASWCGPCRQENPNVVMAYNKYKNKNFTILGVSLDQDKDAWEAAVAKDNLTWNHMSDLKQWDTPAVQAYGFDGIPFNVLVDPSGKIIASGLRGEDLDKKLEEVLK